MRPVRSQNNLKVPRKLIDVTNMAISTENRVSKSVYSFVAHGVKKLVDGSRWIGGSRIFVRLERDCFYYIIVRTYDVGLHSRRNSMYVTHCF